MLLVADVRPELRVDDRPRAHAMPTCATWVNEVRSTIPAVTHVDYSARLQTVAQRDEPRVPRRDRGVRASSPAARSSSTRRSTCAASRSCAPPKTPTGASCAPRWTRWCWRTASSRKAATSPSSPTTRRLGGRLRPRLIRQPGVRQAGGLSTNNVNFPTRPTSSKHGSCAGGREVGVLDREHDEAHALAVEHPVGPVGERRGRARRGSSIPSCSSSSAMPAPTQVDPAPPSPGSRRRRRPRAARRAPSSVRPRTQRDPGASGLPGARRRRRCSRRDTTTSAAATTPSATRPTRGSRRGARLPPPHDRPRDREPREHPERPRPDHEVREDLADDARHRHEAGRRSPARRTHVEPERVLGASPRERGGADAARSADDRDRGRAAQVERAAVDVADDAAAHPVGPRR